MLARPELLTALGAGPVRAIGKGYVTLPKAERDVASLREAILDARPLRARFLGAASPAIADLVRDDFAHGRTVVLNGWILSLTEARQCALFALLA